ncbi:uncharacterized protein LOC144102685 [Amblyomma americanum]
MAASDARGKSKVMFLKVSSFRVSIMYNGANYDPAANAQGYGQYGYEPAAYAQAYSQYGYDPAQYGQYGYDPAAYAQAPYGQAPPGQANRGLLLSTSAVPKNQGESSGNPFMLMISAMLLLVCASVAITAFVLRGGIGPEILICTYGRRTTADRVMASDGLCDIAFYDSIYADGRNILGDNRFGSDLVTFMGAVARYRKTKLGVAFAFQHIDQLGNDLRRTNPNPLQVFWQRRIYHTGVLDTPPNATRSQMMIAMSRIMILDRFAQSQRALNHRALTALSLPTPAREWIYFINDEFKRLQFIPDLLVVYGHYPFGDNTVDNCAVMPPTRLSAVPLALELRGSYSYDMRAVLELSL